MESRTQASRPRPRTQPSRPRPRPRTSKLSSRILEDEDLSSRTPTLELNVLGEAPNTLHIYSVIGNGQNSKLLPLKSLVQNMQWLVKSVSSSFSKDLSHEANAKTKDFQIVLEDPRGRGLVLEDSNTGKLASQATLRRWSNKGGEYTWQNLCWDSVRRSVCVFIHRQLMDLTRRIVIVIPDNDLSRTVNSYHVATVAYKANQQHSIVVSS